MSIGLSASKADLDAQIGQVTLAMREATKSAHVLKKALDRIDVAGLQTLGYSSNEANQIKSAAVDLEKIAAIWDGTATQATVYDFQTFAGLLTGFR